MQRAATAQSRRGRSAIPNAQAAAASSGSAIALRNSWNCQSPASSAITRTKLSVKPIIAMPATIIAAPKPRPVPARIPSSAASTVRPRYTRRRAR